MISYVIPIEAVEGVNDAPTYTLNFRMIQITKCIVIKNGTKNNKPTVDIQFKDEKGNEYVMMTTGELIISVNEVIKGLMANNLDNQTN